MPVEEPIPRISKSRLRTGRILTILNVLFLLFDAGIKFTHSPQMLQICAKLGLPVHLLPVIGVILLVCTVLYAIPQTTLLGALFLTGYLGGAVAIQMRAGGPVFDTIFPVLFAVLVWASILLRDDHLRRLILPRKQ